MNTAYRYTTKETIGIIDWSFITTRVCIYCSVIQIVVTLSLLALKA